MSSKSVCVNLQNILEEEGVGPIRLGRSLFDIGEILGPPKYWDGLVPGSKGFDMGFGGLEVGFYMRNDVPEIVYISIQTKAFENGSMVVGRNKKGEEFKISHPFGKKKLTLNLVRKFLGSSNIGFKEIDNDLSNDFAPILMVGSSIKLYARKDQSIFKIEIAKDWNNPT